MDKYKGSKRFKGIKYGFNWRISAGGSDIVCGKYGIAFGKL